MYANGPGSIRNFAANGVRATVCRWVVNLNAMRALGNRRSSWCATVRVSRETQPRTAFRSLKAGSASHKTDESAKSVFFDGIADLSAGRKAIA